MNPSQGLKLSCSPDGQGRASNGHLGRLVAEAGWHPLAKAMAIWVAKSHTSHFCDLPLLEANLGANVSRTGSAGALGQPAQCPLIAALLIAPAIPMPQAPHALSLVAAQRHPGTGLPAQMHCKFYPDGTGLR
jgi:hypothetical protein